MFWGLGCGRLWEEYSPACHTNLFKMISGSEFLLSQNCWSLSCLTPTPALCSCLPECRMQPSQHPLKPLTQAGLIGVWGREEKLRQLQSRNAELHLFSLSIPLHHWEYCCCFLSASSVGSRILASCLVFLPPHPASFSSFLLPLLAFLLSPSLPSFCLFSL